MPFNLQFQLGVKIKRTKRCSFFTYLVKKATEAVKGCNSRKIVHIILNQVVTRCTREWNARDVDAKSLFKNTCPADDQCIIKIKGKLKISHFSARANIKPYWLARKYKTRGRTVQSKLAMEI